MAPKTTSTAFLYMTVMIIEDAALTLIALIPFLVTMMSAKQKLYYVFDGLRKSLENKENVLRRALRKNRALIK